MIKLSLFRLFLASFLSVLLGASVVPAQAAEREVYRYSFQGQSIYADMYGYNDCTSTSLSISASAGRTKTDGRPTQSSMVSGWISQYNYCDGSYMYGYVVTELGEDSLQIDRHLQSATLNINLQVCDYGCFPAALQLTWTGVGDTFRDKSHYQSSSPYYKTMYRFDGQTRQSTVSGTLTTLWGTTDLQTNYASIQSLKSASISMYRIS